MSGYDPFFLPMLTAIGAVSLFPEVPKLIIDIDKLFTVAGVPLLRWLFTFIAVLQGGASGNAEVAAITILVFFVFLTAIDILFPEGFLPAEKGEPVQIGSLRPIGPGVATTRADQRKSAAELLAERQRSQQ